MRRLALGVIALYPRPWRERYAAEMRALLAEQAVDLRALVDLSRACLDAHLHPSGLAPVTAEQLRGTVSAALSCWIGFVICGAGFAKLTEDHPFAAAAHAYPLIGMTRLAIAGLAAVSAAAVVLGGGRLIVEVVAEALTDRRWPLVRAVCAPFAALAGFAAATGVVVLLARGGVAAHTVAAWIVFLAWVASGLAGAAVCGLAPRAALSRAHPRFAALRNGVLGSAVVTAALAAMTCLTLAYTAAIAADVPSLAAEPNGPFGLVSTTAGLGIVAALMAGLTALSAVTSVRGLRAVRAADDRS